MNEKINLPDLIHLLSEKAKISKKEAEVFLKECFLLMEEGLLQDQSVKIKNLGTFKLVLIKDRESVDVTTGQRVTIPSHYKISFVADKDFSETINEPFALFQAEEIIVDKEEIAEKLAEKIVEEITEEEIIEEERQPEETIEDEKVEQKEPGEETIEHSPIQTESQNMNTDVFWDMDFDPSQHNRKRKRKRRHFNWKVFFIIMTLCLFGGFIFYVDFIDRNPGYQFNIKDIRSFFSSFLPNNLIKEKADTTTVVIDLSKKGNEEEPAATSPEETFDSEQLNVKEEVSVNKETTNKLDENTKKRILKQGERLTTIALEEFGDKSFWVYIYEENKGIIPDPNNVKAGIELIIPPATKYGIDRNNPESVRKAKDIQSRF